MCVQILRSVDKYATTYKEFLISYASILANAKYLFIYLRCVLPQTEDRTHLILPWNSGRLHVHSVNASFASRIPSKQFPPLGYPRWKNYIFFCFRISVCMWKSSLLIGDCTFVFLVHVFRVPLQDYVSHSTRSIIIIPQILGTSDQKIPEKSFSLSLVLSGKLHPTLDKNILNSLKICEM